MPTDTVSPSVVVVDGFARAPFSSAVPSVLDHVDSDAHRRMLFLAQRIARRFGHADDFGGFAKRQAPLYTDEAGDQRTQLVVAADQNQVQPGMFFKRRDRRPHDDFGAQVAAHRIECDYGMLDHQEARVSEICSKPAAARSGAAAVALVLFVFFGLLDDLVAAVEAVGGNVVAQVRFTGGRIDRK
jgi:hypothetical protein